MNNEELILLIHQLGEKDAEKIADKVQAANIPDQDKARIMITMIHIMDCYLGMHGWHSIKFFTEILADRSKQLLNIVGLVDTETPEP